MGRRAGEITRLEAWELAAEVVILPVLHAARGRSGRQTDETRSEHGGA